MRKIVGTLPTMNSAQQKSQQYLIPASNGKENDGQGAGVFFSTSETMPLQSQKDAKSTSETMPLQSQKDAKDTKNMY